MATQDQATRYARDAMKRGHGAMFIYRIGSQWMYHPLTCATAAETVTRDVQPHYKPTITEFIEVAP